MKIKEFQLAFVATLVLVGNACTGTQKHPAGDNGEYAAERLARRRGARDPQGMDAQLHRAGSDSSGQWAITILRRAGQVEDHPSEREASTCRVCHTIRSTSGFS